MPSFCSWTRLAGFRPRVLTAALNQSPRASAVSARWIRKLWRDHDQQHPGQVRRVSEGVLRVLFGAFLAIVAIALVLYNAQWFAAVTVLMTLFAAREWHRMVRSADKAAEGRSRPSMSDHHYRRHHRLRPDRAGAAGRAGGLRLLGVGDSRFVHLGQPA